MEEACSNFIDLQTVDMCASHSEITEHIMQQMQSLGFLALSNIPDYNEQELFAHQKWFFSLSDKVKQKLYKQHFAPENKNIYRGLAPFVDNDPSHKELYEVGLDWSKVSEEERATMLHEQTPWP
jgi:isopenicillin N synthase-like dioxygenase